VQPPDAVKHAWYQSQVRRRGKILRKRLGFAALRGRGHLTREHMRGNPAPYRCSA
jgi:hypothetical protein